MVAIPVQFVHPPVCGPLSWSRARLNLVVETPQFRKFPIRMFLKSQTRLSAQFVDHSPLVHSEK